MKTEIFNLIKTHEFKKIYDIIKSKKITNLDIRDTNYNYFIQFIINYNQIDIIKLILDMAKEKSVSLRLDILDTDGRSILYNCIKFNYLDIMELLINYNKINIGISIIDIKDRLGLTALHYSVIFNNFDTFELLLKNHADPYILSNDGNNIFVTALMYNRTKMFEYLLERQFNINFTSSNNETILQIAANYKNEIITNRLLEYNINLNNTTADFGLSILHQSIILDNFELFKKLLEKNININITDFYGNTPLHYIFIDKKLNYINSLFKFTNIKFNMSNINGELPLHILLNNESDIDELDDNILKRIILETDLNYQDNKGVTCLMKIINNNLTKRFYDLLIIKPLNFYIEDANSKHISITDDIVDLIVESYYNQIKLNKDDLIVDWELWCSQDNYEKLKNIITKKDNKNSAEICKTKIREIIVKERRTLPKYSNIELFFDNGIFTNYCFYTGSPIDVLFGLVLLKRDFKNISLVLDYPLTINNELESYYNKLGIDYHYKVDFSNIEIIWSYQKLIYPSYFNDYINNKIKEFKFVVIPIGIETSVGSHANILLWDVKNKTIERFEPNGSNYPVGLNYNPMLLDNLLENKFKLFDPKIKYYAPYTFLPTIGFQMLENLESEKCKKIGDPNGFCAVWCIWWVYQRMLNIENKKFTIENIAEEIIKQIKFDNQSFKSLIRNFSKKITEIRDTYLKKYNLDINDWIVENYSEDNLNKIEKDVLKNIKIL